jgi:hypothetical protein
MPQMLGEFTIGRISTGLGQHPIQLGFQTSGRDHNPCDEISWWL